MERFTYGTAELVHANLYTLSLDHESSATELVAQAHNKAASKTDRFRAGVSLVVKPLEKVGLNPKASLHNWYHNAQHLPFGADGEQSPTPLLGFGLESFVYTLGADGDRVLKIDRRSIGKSTDELVSIAQGLQTDHEQLTKWYEEIPGFVIPSTFIVGQLPYQDKPAVGIIQPKIENYKGVFEDYTDNELHELFASDDNLRDSFRKMTAIFSARITESQQCFDIVGNRNLVIRESAEGNTLHLLDSCSIKNLTEPQDPRFAHLHAVRKSKIEKLASAIYSAA